MKLKIMTNQHHDKRADLKKGSAKHGTKPAVKSGMAGDSVRSSVILCGYML